MKKSLKQIESIILYLEPNMKSNLRRPQQKGHSLAHLQRRVADLQAYVLFQWIVDSSILPK